MHPPPNRAWPVRITVLGSALLLSVACGNSRQSRWIAEGGAPSSDQPNPSNDPNQTDDPTNSEPPGDQASGRDPLDRDAEASEPTPVDASPDGDAHTDGCDMAAVLSKHACSNNGCHGEQPQGDLDLLSPGIEQRLVGVASTTGACSGRLLVDPAQPESSLILQLIDPERFAQPDHCGVMMPFGSNDGVGNGDLRCFRQWVQKMAEDVPSPRPPAVVFEPVAAASYTNKVKTLLTGGALTDAELAQVSADPAALRTLIGGWIAKPEFSTKMSAFFAGALQQRLIGSLNTQLDGVQGTWGASLISNLQESFTRTALDIVSTGRPFTEVVTTRRWAATSATLLALAYLDNTATALRSEKHQVLSSPLEGMPAPPFSLSYSVANHAWLFPSIPAECVVPAQTLPNVLDMLLGAIHCSNGKTVNLAKTATALSAADFSDWRFVDIGSATAADPAPRFYDLDRLRGLAQINLKVPRVGFFTSPAFLANWDTNDDNQFRVTTSQTIITALGEVFSPADRTPTSAKDGLSEAHTAPGTTCYGCHQFLDPMRLYFGNALSTKYQGAEKPMTGTPFFAFDGYSKSGGDLFSLATTLTQHPHFSAAWVQKLCFYANSQACDEKDPEFQRISAAFVASKYDFKALVRELFGSALVTGVTPTQTFETQPYLLSITRSQHLCQLLDARLGTTGSCALAASFANLIPDDEFSRGSATPVQPAVTSLFHFSAAEKLCDALSSKWVGTSATSLFNPLQPTAALDRLTQNLMGLPPSHPRYASTRAALLHHLGQANTGSNVTIAMRSTFTLACLSPDVMALGL